MNLSLPPSLVRLRSILAVVVPLVVLYALVVVAIAPRMRAGAAARARQAPLQERVVSLQRTVAMGEAVGDSADVLREFERRTAADDRVPELLERLAQGSKVHNLTIETGARAAVPKPAGDDGAERLDPRLGLFPQPLSFTPITVGFDSSYAELGESLWQLRGLPTTIEIRSLEIGPSAEPALVHARLVLVAFQREPSPRPAFASRTGEPPPVSPVRMTSQPSAIDPAAIPVPATIDLSTPPVWTRNPFVASRPVSVARNSISTPAAPAVADPVVRSILFSAQRTAALVDSRVVGVGDRVSAGRVVEIERDAIVVETPGGERRRFTLRRGSFAGRAP